MMDRASVVRTPSSIHLPSLATAVTVMLVSTLYPPMMTDALGHADHGVAAALFVAMTAGFVRGVGFVPHLSIWRWLFSSWSCLVALALAGWLKFLH